MERSAGRYTVLNTICVGQHLKESLSIPMCGGSGGQSICLMSSKPGVFKVKMAATEMLDFFKMESLGL